MDASNQTSGMGISLRDCAERLNALQSQVETEREIAIDTAGKVFGLMSAQAALLEQVKEQTDDLDEWVRIHAPKVAVKACYKAKHLLEQQEFRGLYSVAGLMPEQSQREPTHTASPRDALVSTLGRLATRFNGMNPSEWWAGLRDHERTLIRANLQSLRALVEACSVD